MQSLLNFSSRARLPLILQTEAAECGLACLAMIASYYGHRVDLNTLRRRYPVSLKGVTLRGLVQIASHLGLASRPLRFELTQLRQLHVPAIVHWDMNHFVVLKARTNTTVFVHDPAAGEIRLSLNDASKHLTGVALELSPAESFTPQNEAANLPLSAFWPQMSGTTHALAQILVLSIILEIFTIISPFYMQLVIDDVIVRGDIDFLLVLAIGFGLLTTIKVVSTAIRSYILLIFQNTLHFQMGARLFHHLIRLPLVYFEKRHMGDILSRFTSLEPIRILLTEGMITAIIDGLMAIATLVMMFVYSIQLSVVVLIAFLLYGAVRLALYSLLLRRSNANIQAKAKEQSVFIESVRAIQSLKLFNRESERETYWLNRYAESMNTNARLGSAKITFKTVNDAIVGLENMLGTYLAARLALDNVLSVGMIFAFLSYKLNFLTKSLDLIEKALDFRILDLHLERLADIALSPPERGHDQLLSYPRPIQGRIELRNLCFRYAESEPLVLENINLIIEPKQFVSIMGPSGGGKTTLMKIMLGLLEPTSGEVLIDGVPLSTLGVRAYREQVGAIMQEDQLLSGSIADNICFFDHDFDREWMIECAQIAGIHNEIMSMPMTYNSLIGDMGSSLSGGQKQRVVLARALYRRPKILFLDEGTAHLDVDKERYINERLRSLDITRISIAHRPEIMNAADKIVRIGRAC
jgi:ATP-binding cassette, subfamily B, bacterial CvaB/MchF/RaxB